MKCRPEYVKECKCPEEVLNCIRETAGESLLELELRERLDGNPRRALYRDIWVKLDKTAYLTLVDRLRTIDFLHFHVMSGNDDGEAVTLNVHCSLFREAGEGTRLGITIVVPIPKANLSIPSLNSRIPGTEYSEREMREMLGIHFEGLPNTDLLFLPEEWDEEIKPWRRDETGPAPEHIRELS
ncbi:MAG: NADH-quinone oxidoreductase subunit C [Synergistales bacterium]